MCTAGEWGRPSPMGSQWDSARTLTAAASPAAPAAQPHLWRAGARQGQRQWTATHPRHGISPAPHSWAEVDATLLASMAGQGGCSGKWGSKKHGGQHQQQPPTRAAPAARCCSLACSSCCVAPPRAPLAMAGAKAAHSVMVEAVAARSGMGVLEAGGRFRPNCAKAWRQACSGAACMGAARGLLGGLCAVCWVCRAAAVWQLRGCCVGAEGAGLQGGGHAMQAPKQHEGQAAAAGCHAPQARAHPAPTSPTLCPSPAMPHPAPHWLPHPSTATFLHSAGTLPHPSTPVPRVRGRHSAAPEPPLRCHCSPVPGLSPSPHAHPAPASAHPALAPAPAHPAPAPAPARPAPTPPCTQALPARLPGPQQPWPGA